MFVDSWCNQNEVFIVCRWLGPNNYVYLMLKFNWNKIILISKLVTSLTELYERQQLLLVCFKTHVFPAHVVWLWHCTWFETKNITVTYASKICSSNIASVWSWSCVAIWLFALVDSNMPHWIKQQKDVIECLSHYFVFNIIIFYIWYVSVSLDFVNRVYCSITSKISPWNDHDANCLKQILRSGLW